MTDRESKIRERAYGIWEKEGYPHGRADDHWHRAASEVETETGNPAPTMNGTAPVEAAPKAKVSGRKSTAAAPVDAEAAPKTKARATPARKRTTKP